MNKQLMKGALVVIGVVALAFMLWYITGEQETIRNFDNGNHYIALDVEPNRPLLANDTLDVTFSLGHGRADYGATAHFVVKIDDEWYASRYVFANDRQLVNTVLSIPANELSEGEHDVTLYYVSNRQDANDRTDDVCWVNTETDQEVELIDYVFGWHRDLFGWDGHIFELDGITGSYLTRCMQLESSSRAWGPWSMVEKDYIYSEHPYIWNPTSGYPDEIPYYSDLTVANVFDEKVEGHYGTMSKTFYVVLEGEEEPEEEPPVQDEEGINMMYFIFGGAALLIVGGAILLYRRVRKKR